MLKTLFECINLSLLKTLFEYRFHLSFFHVRNFRNFKAKRSVIKQKDQEVKRCGIKAKK